MNELNTISMSEDYTPSDILEFWFAPDNKPNWFKPLMHSKNLNDQKLLVQLFHSNPESYAYAKKHMKIIEKFNRFPHWNKALGRLSTEEEVTFLLTPNSAF
jgi:uncharacterized protein (DUF924 family)